MKRKDIEKAAIDYSGRDGGVTLKMEIYSFMAGANWRINNVWHKPNGDPVSFCSLLLIENSNGEFDLGYKFDPATTKRWAYVKDLTPNLEECV